MNIEDWDTSIEAWNRVITLDTEVSNLIILIEKTIHNII